MTAPSLPAVTSTKDTYNEARKQIDVSDVNSLTPSDRVKIWKTMAGKWSGRGSAGVERGNGAYYPGRQSSIDVILSVKNGVQITYFLLNTEQFIGTASVAEHYTYSASRFESYSGEISLHHTDGTRAIINTCNGRLTIDKSKSEDGFKSITFSGSVKGIWGMGQVTDEKFSLWINLVGNKQHGYKLVADTPGGREILMQKN